MKNGWYFQGESFFEKTALIAMMRIATGPFLISLQLTK